MKPLAIRYRYWRLLVGDTTATGTRDGQHFELDGLADFETALRAGKAEINKREGEQEWNQEYTNEALQ